ncbi:MULTISPECIES: ABC transporter permease [Prauserella salsuginis group]|uniref:ABC-2 type transport system permease protein n=2 Tax=Prauserella salsuginis group TaxID=2893672 RepID=A0A839XW51_9PSEU|nr:MULTISPECIES: ABC transporter permease [Prauserella salsuginis group]MBB3664015.1 ABC-2 type transport system permease protein [Prauserella sediminis]MCR3721470.1 ABC-2 type transport system permease protein [Prauserella flava]MCR3732460.1 ABC-2 type transport system permease protein [Prauserella salsuginis]
MTSVEERTSVESRNDSGGVTFMQATWLVAEREIKAFVQMKGFWIGLAAIVIGLFAASILPNVLGGGDTKVAVTSTEVAQTLEAGSFDVERTDDVAAAEELVRTEEVEAAVVPDTTGQSATGVEVVALENPPSDLMASLGSPPPVNLLEPGDVSEGEKQLVIMAFALVFMLFAMGGTAIAQSAVTEKQTRVVEILVSTLPVKSLLAGKIVGHTLLTVGQVIVLAIAAPIALQAGGNEALLEVILPALGWYVPFLVFAFVLLASMWAVAGSLVSRQEDLGSTMGLVMALVFGPYMLVIMLSDNATAMTVLSYVPFSAAIAMPVRLFTGEAQLWEPFVSLGLIAVMIVVITAVATRLYTGSLLQTGGKVKLSRAWSSASD